MTIARSAGDVLDDHVEMEIECIDRLYLNLYQPKLQHELGVVGYFKNKGYQFVSSALMDPMTKTFVSDIHRFIQDRRYFSLAGATGLDGEQFLLLWL